MRKTLGLFPDTNRLPDIESGVPEVLPGVPVSQILRLKT